MTAAESKHSTVQPHAVAALLTDEMKARVRDTEFGRFGHGDKVRARDPRNPHNCCGICPLSVAFGLSGSRPAWAYAERLGFSEQSRAARAFRSFIAWADNKKSDPADVYALLGCDTAAQPSTGGAQ
jgi:hypothetical protein